MDTKMEARPPIGTEALIQALLPPTVREEIAGDLRERYRSPTQYLCEALSLLPALWLSQIRRGSSPFMLGLQAFILFACLGGFAIENILAAVPMGTEPCFYRTSAGAEIDLVLEMGKRERC